MGNIGVQQEGYAFDAPYLYFTVVALDGIADLFSDRTRLLGLLDDEQQRLSAALQLRWDLTQQFWATIASFGGGRWPLEDIPWCTGDELESEFFSLLVTSIAARDLAERRNTDIDLSRLGSVLTELANRGRINRRPLLGDPAIRMHDPGVPIPLEGTENFGPPLKWTVSDFAPLLLKRLLRVASLIIDIELRGQMLRLADKLWGHIAERRFAEGPYVNLWDQPSNVFEDAVETFNQPSWHHTLRVVESLILAADLNESDPLRNNGLDTLARELLASAEQLFDHELLAESGEAGRDIGDLLESVRRRMHRAREILGARPASSAALLLGVLSDFETLEAARHDVQNQA